MPPDTLLEIRASPQKGVRINVPTEVHPHPCTQHRQQTGGAGSCCAAGKLQLWDGSHNWSAVMDGQEGQAGERGSGAALWVQGCSECLSWMMVALGSSVCWQMCWWESVREHPPRMERQMRWRCLPCKQLGEVSQLLALVLMGQECPGCVWSEWKRTFLLSW